jgi:hypothetical protein
MPGFYASPRIPSNNAAHHRSNTTAMVGALLRATDLAMAAHRG